jgi:glucosamine--fructose-6-phosphate aminotransferase (isomerizing)
MERVLSYVRSELVEQPDRVAAVLARRDEVAALADRLRGRFDDVLFAARGSSDNAARYAAYVFAIRHRLPAALAMPSVVSRFGAIPDLRRTLVIGISQSGESPDVVEVVAAAARQGAPTLAITNEPGSPLGSAAEEVFALSAGPEFAVAATKTYTCSLAAVALLSAVLADEEVPAGIPDAMAEVIAATVPDRAIEPWIGARRGIVVGRGYEFATAHETALKLQELGAVIAQAHSAADVRHGPIGGLTGEVPVLVLGVHGTLAGDLVDGVRELARRAPVTVIGDPGDAHPDVVWSLPHLDEWVMPLMTVVAGQRLAVELAAATGLDEDRPQGLTKVTRTR